MPVRMDENPLNVGYCRTFIRHGMPWHEKYLPQAIPPRAEEAALAAGLSPSEVGDGEDETE